MSSSLSITAVATTQLDDRSTHAAALSDNTNKRFPHTSYLSSFLRQHSSPHFLHTKCTIVMQKCTIYIYPQNKHFYNIKTYDLYFLSGISSHARFCSMDSVGGVSDKYQVCFQLCSLLKCLPLCVATQCHSHKCSEI